MMKISFPQSYWVLPWLRELIWQEKGEKFSLCEYLWSRYATTCFGWLHTKVSSVECVLLAEKETDLMRRRRRPCVICDVFHLTHFLTLWRSHVERWERLSIASMICDDKRHSRATVVVWSFKSLPSSCVRPFFSVCQRRTCERFRDYTRIKSDRIFTTFLTSN